MVFGYYPGCTLKNKAQALDIYARRCAGVLGVELCEIEDWQCCGGAFTTARDEIATKLSSVRVLGAARKTGLVTVCAACHNVVKQTAHALKNDAEFRNKAARYTEEEPPADTAVYHYLELLRDVIGFDKLREKTVAPLSGRKIAAYYGCLLLRPNSVMAMDDPESPRIMEDMLRAIGAEAVIWANRNECCGGYAAVHAPHAAEKRSKAVVENARAAGADTIVTACPLCKYNLEKCGGIKVVYFTELLAGALGVLEEEI